MKRVSVLTAIAGAVVALGASSAGAAVLTMSLTDVTGSTSVFCDNGIGGCAGGFSGLMNGPLLSYSGAVGSWNTALTATTTNSPGTPTLATLDLTQLVLTNQTNAARTFEILVTGFGYTTPPGDPLDFFGSASTSSQGVTGLVDSFSYFDPTNSGALANQIACSFVPGTNNSCAQNAFSVNNGGGAYSLSHMLRITLNGGQSINLTGNASVRNVPEPGTVALLGLSIFGLAALRRRSE